MEPCFGTSRVSSGVPLATRGTGRGGGEGSSGGEGYTRTCVTLGVSEADRWIWEGIRARTAGRGERGAGKDREGVRRDERPKAKGRAAAARFGGQAKRSSDGRMPSNRGHLTRRGAQTYMAEMAMQPMGPTGGPGGHSHGGVPMAGGEGKG